MRFIDYVRILAPYTASASYTLPELATICFDGKHVYASDGISSLSLEAVETVRGLCVKAGPVLNWLNAVGDEQPFTVGLMDGNLKVQSRVHGRLSSATFPISPVGGYRLKVETSMTGVASAATLEDSTQMADALAYVLKRSGTDSTFKWASGVTLAFEAGQMRALMTDNITMAVGGCDLEVRNPFTCMITHSAAQRLQALCASYAGELRAGLYEGKLFVQVNDAIFSTVIVEDADAVDNFYGQIEPYSEMDTFDPGVEFIEAVRRHGQFAGRDGAATRIKVKGAEATLITNTESGRTKDRVAIFGAGEQEVEICTGASVLSRMLTDGASFNLTEDAIVTRDLRGNMALLCAWDEEGA